MKNKLFFWIVVLLVIAVALYGLYRIGKGESEQDYGQWYEQQSRDHIADGAAHDPYNSNPPSSGPHYGETAQTGIYNKELPDEQIVHNLEHSHVWISYQPASVSAETINQLADISKDVGSKVIMTPRASNDSPIAIIAWQRVLKMDTLDADIMKRFIKRYRGTAGPPEERAIPDFGFKDFRGQ